MTQQPYVNRALVQVYATDWMLKTEKTVPGNLQKGDEFNILDKRYEIIEIINPEPIDSQAWLHTLEVIRKINTISSAKTMAAYLVFANASPEESHFDTWSRAYQAAKAEPYAKWEYEGS